MKRGKKEKKKEEEEEKYIGGRKRKEWSSYLHSPGTVQLPCSVLQPCLQIAGKKHKERKVCYVLHIYTSKRFYQRLTTLLEKHLLSVQLANQLTTGACGRGGEQLAAADREQQSEDGRVFQSMWPSVSLTPLVDEEHPAVTTTASANRGRAQKD